MRSTLPTLCLSLLPALLFLPASPAQAQSGILLKTFPLEAGKLLLDPSRPQIYATLPADNSLAVIDTNTNTVVTTFFIGSNPTDLAISPDGTRLYVANSGSTAAGVGVVDLTSSSFTVLPSLPAPFAPSLIVAGLANRLYVGSQEPSTDGTSIAQIDATTGVAQEPFTNQGFAATNTLAISPDRKTLYIGNGDIVSYDVSTATPSLLQSSQTGSGSSLILSHNGEFLVAPGNGSGDGTALISTANLNSIFGTFNTGSYPSVGTFSLDDSLFYQVQFEGGNNNGGSRLKVFSTHTFTQLDSFDLPYDDSGYPPEYSSLAITSPNGYLYVASTASTFDGGPADLILVSTRTAPFFSGAVALSDGFFYLQFSDGVPFGYYNFNYSPYLYHNDLGFEYPIDAADGSAGIYLYDFASQTFFYTSPSLFPYLYDFTLNSFLYYYPNAQRPGYYTSNPRYFYDFASQTIITK